MGVMKTIFYTIFILILSFVIFFFYSAKDIDSTARGVALSRYCNLKNLESQSSHPIYDEYNLGVDKFAEHFISHVSSRDTLCSFLDNSDMLNSVAQRTFKLDKILVDTFMNNTDFEQFVILGAGMMLIIY